MELSKLRAFSFGTSVAAAAAAAKADLLDIFGLTHHVVAIDSRRSNEVALPITIPTRIQLKYSRIQLGSPVFAAEAAAAKGFSQRPLRDE